MNIVYRKSILVGLTVLFLLACNATFTVGYPTPTNVPPTEPPTATSAPLISQQVTLVSQPYIESNQDPVFTITAQIPQLTGSDDPRVQSFNQRLNDLVQNEITAFQQEFTNAPVVEVTTSSYLEVTYTLISQYDDIWSIKFVHNFYTNGAAHPGDFSHTVNYDLGQGRELGLGDLFLPNSDYLEAISNYCITELGKQPFFDGAFTTGADPTPENYRNWNITPQGLMITFDTNQVAPGAAGPQVVTVPYDQLQAVIDPQGALAGVNY
ncbi:MAG: DUF3298 and DUF4163 domain-containing protein [Anaerolineae bacterium]|nr:DUF3298 and DUF4163 domain-containing protein [Anaerolineae bacterium]